MHLRILVTAVVLSLLLACQKAPSYPPLIVLADSAIIHGNYREADSLIHIYAHTQRQESQDERMYRQLVEAERLFVYGDLNDTHFNMTDSLCRYYSKNHQTENYAKALLCQGNVYESISNYPKALEQYLKANELAVKSGNHFIEALVNKQLGEVFFMQGIYGECTNHFRKFSELSESNHDTLRMTHAAMRMGRVYTIENKPDSIIMAYKQALEWATNYPFAHHLIPYAKYNLCDTYIQMEQFEKAKDLLPRDSFNMMNWAYWHYGQQHTDSAIWYFEKTLNSLTHKGKAEILRLLAALEQEKNNQKKALEYTTLLVSTEDSIKMESLEEETKQVKSNYTLEKIHQERNNLERQRNVAFTIVSALFISLLFMCMAGFYAWKYYQRRNIERLKQERMLRKEQADKLRISSQQVAANQAEIERLQHQLDVAKEKNDQTSVNKLTLEKQTLMAQNKNIESKRCQQHLLEEQMRSSFIYQRIKLNAGNEKFKIKEEEWEQLAELIDKTYDSFTCRLLNLADLSETEMRVCYLIKIGVASAHIALLMFKTKGAVTMMRQRMYQKITKQKGTATQLNLFIQEF
jgi:tetratricopeptide (TPR) repeat protein